MKEIEEKLEEKMKKEIEVKLEERLRNMEGNSTIDLISLRKTHFAKTTS